MRGADHSPSGAQSENSNSHGSFRGSDVKDTNGAGRLTLTLGCTGAWLKGALEQ
jgi:hypothetical protein